MRAQAVDLLEAVGHVENGEAADGKNHRQVEKRFLSKAKVVRVFSRVQRCGALAMRVIAIGQRSGGGGGGGGGGCGTSVVIVLGLFISDCQDTNQEEEGGHYHLPRLAGAELAV